MDYKAIIVDLDNLLVEHSRYFNEITIDIATTLNQTLDPADSVIDIKNNIEANYNTLVKRSGHNRNTYSEAVFNTFNALTGVRKDSIPRSTLMSVEDQIWQLSDILNFNNQYYVQEGIKLVDNLLSSSSVRYALLYTIGYQDSIEYYRDQVESRMDNKFDELVVVDSRTETHAKYLIDDLDYSPDEILAINSSYRVSNILNLIGCGIDVVKFNQPINDKSYNSLKDNKYFKSQEIDENLDDIVERLFLEDSNLTTDDIGDMIGVDKLGDVLKIIKEE